MNKPQILIIDDDTAVCASISLLLKRSGFGANHINRPKLVEKALLDIQPDLVLLDMNFTIDTSGKKGLELLQLIQTLQPGLSVILMTGWATVQLAVEGMKGGASDFIAKPWDNKQLLHSIRTVLSLQGDKKPEETKGTNFSHIIGEDAHFLHQLQLAQRVSNTNASVLVTGESGTGKELIAEAIHYESERAHQAFVKVNLGGISTSLFESEMFGHKKGAYTDAITDRKGRFAMADGGTIFLDEIGDLELNSQVKLLRVLQENTFEVLGSSQSQRVDVRVISATHKDLESMVIDGSFREDLFYRINLIKIHIPPLRERPKDIPLLVQFFLKNLRMIYDRPQLKVSKSAFQWLQQQQFPGNIRQLKNLVERSVLVSTSEVLETQDFQRHYQDRGLSKEEELPAVGKLSLEEMEIKAIKKALNFHDYQISPTARSLGITRSALYRRLQKYNIPYEH